jgi:hypothetical protein
MKLTHCILTSLVAALILVAGCSSQNSLLGRESVAERSGDKPSLVSDNQWSDVKHDPHRFVGMVSGVKDVDVAIREAEIDARRRIVESVVDSLRSIGSRATTGASNEGVGRYLNDVLTWVAGSTEVVGTRLKETYWEKIARQMSSSVTYTYQAWAIVEISKEDYAVTRINALNKIEERARADRNAEAEALARQALEAAQGGGAGAVR